MPISKENKARYPKDWKQISLRIRERAGHKCEECGVANYSIKPNGTKVVLTVAHLNHQPEDCSDENLRAWCQKCHLAYDQQHHMMNARRTRFLKKGQPDLLPP